MSKSVRTGVRRRIALALTRVEAEISGHAALGGRYAGAMSGEGYSGGYRDALLDAQLLLNGVTPHRRHYYDPPPTPESRSS